MLPDFSKAHSRHTKFRIFNPALGPAVKSEFDYYLLINVHAHQGETILNFFKKMKDPDPLMDAKSDSKTFL